jgi:hypothetical protein
MRWQRGIWAAAAAAALLCAGQLVTNAGAPARVKARGDALTVLAGQTDYLTHEPILVTARLQTTTKAQLPPGPGKAGDTTLSFEITPTVKARKGAKPLPLETEAATLPANIRTYDLLEWFEFPAEGSWTVLTVVEQNGKVLKSAPLKVAIRRPGKGDKEQNPVNRLHHLPWSNYTTNAFCGDCFDLVKQWSDSRLARYAHYWNGIHSQNKKEYDKALASFRKAAEYPNFILANHARYGAGECLRALGRNREAAETAEELLASLEQRDGRAMFDSVLLLARGLSKKVEP